MQGEIFPSLPVPSYLSNQIHSHNRPFHFGRLDWKSGGRGGGDSHRAGVTPWRTVLPTWLAPFNFSVPQPFSPSLLSPFHLRSKIKSSFCLSKHFNFCPDNLRGSATMDSDLTPTPQVKDTGLSYRHSCKFRDARPLPLLTSWLQAQGFSLPFKFNNVLRWLTELRKAP